VRVKRQRGHGGHKVRVKRQRGHGKRWNAFKGAVKGAAQNAWNEVKPKVVSIGRDVFKQAIPGLAKVALNPINREKQLKNLGKDLAKQALTKVIA
jgi:hypothetical protein